jgi:16S rRNA (uracil1498-N3)-methyltransferase
MRLHRFYIEQLDELLGIDDVQAEYLETHTANSEHSEIPHVQHVTEVSFDLSYDRLIHQWRDIFRFTTGDRVILYNEKVGEWLFEFNLLHKKGGTQLRVIEQVKGVRGVLPARNTGLYMAIIKNSNFDLVVEKATELGITEIVPITTKRTIKSGLNFERLQKLAIEASEQSGRMDIPQIRTIVELTQAIEDAKQSYDQVCFGHISDTAHVLTMDQTKNKAIFIGPEGGWSEEEIALFEKEQIIPITLGNYVLRAETAAIVGVGMLV